MNQFETPDWGGEQKEEKWVSGIFEQSNAKLKKKKIRNRNKYPKGFAKSNVSSETATKKDNPPATGKSPNSGFQNKSFNNRLTQSSKYKNKQKRGASEVTQPDYSKPSVKAQKISEISSSSNSLAHSEKFKKSRKRKISDKALNNSKSGSSGDVHNAAHRKKRKNKGDSHNDVSEPPTKVKKTTEKSVKNESEVAAAKDSLPQGKIKEKKRKIEKNKGLEKAEGSSVSEGVSPKGGTSIHEATPQISSSMRKRERKRRAMEKNAKENPNFKINKKRKRSRKLKNLENADVNKSVSEESTLEAASHLTASQRRRRLKKKQWEERAKEDPNFKLNKRKRKKKRKPKSPKTEQGIEGEALLKNGNLSAGNAEGIDNATKEENLETCEKSNQKSMSVVKTENVDEESIQPNDSSNWNVSAEFDVADESSAVVSEKSDRKKKKRKSVEDVEGVGEQTVQSNDSSNMNVSVEMDEENLEVSEKSKKKRKRKRKSVKNSDGTGEQNLQSKDSSSSKKSVDASDVNESLGSLEAKKTKKIVAEENISPSKITPSILDEKSINDDQVSPKELSILTKSQSNEVDNSKEMKKKGPSLREKMEEKLKGARFRFLNEQLYTSKSGDSSKFFLLKPDEFKAYHEGYKQQLNQWPVRPIDIIIKSLKRKPGNLVIADFGCGEAQLAKALPNTVHSFDHVALNEHVTACDMAKTPLSKGSVDVAVFCLSLMGKNLSDYIAEANRVLKMGGLLKIAEVESRFDDVSKFVSLMGKFGFLCTYQDSSNDYFLLFDFRKEKNIKEGKVLPAIELRACSYKKR